MAQFQKQTKIWPLSHLIVTVVWPKQMDCLMYSNFSCLSDVLPLIFHHLYTTCTEASINAVSHNQISEMKIPDFSSTLFAKFLLINRCWQFLFKSSLRAFCPAYRVKIMLLLLLTHASHTLSGNEKQSNHF